VLRDTLLSSLGIATELLTDLGFARHEAEAIVERFREHDARTLERQSEVLADDEAFRKAAMDAAVELRQLFAADTTAEKRVDPG
jgi:hypothetical protein